ncbi:20S proteasome chaperone domain-containing [Pyrenophora seminiperda CCB06]|uniref:20S proteasome chaperone domain-containing n=1 Tax=Pyrenophora seminiperda CCB06 TaxID=1302712 RepID=A0A3M7M8K9_9PLEO|nr:20S proteasome chaperone domain-containing [Pyrenophora seminiperda CCB06]
MALSGAVYVFQLGFAVLVIGREYLMDKMNLFVHLKWWRFSPAISRATYVGWSAPLAMIHHRNLTSRLPLLHPAMAAATTHSNASHAPIEVAFPLPKAPHTNVHLQLTDNGPNLVLFLTTATPESASSTTMGSFVYAMPNRTTPADTLSTPLFTHGSTLDFTTRLAKVLARKTGKPIYVGNSSSFASSGLGGTVEEEMEGFRRVVEVAMGILNERK